MSALTRAVVTRLAIYGGIVVLLLGAIKAWEWKVRQDERVRIATEEASKREDFWRPVAISRKATLKEKVKIFHMQDTLLTVLRDTLIQNKTDTVLVGRFIEQSDSTVKACRSVILSCGQTVLAQDSLIASLEDVNRGLRSSMPGRMSAAKKIALGIVIGFVAGNLATNARK